MKQIILLFAISFHFNVQAQFAPVGTTWNYLHVNPNRWPENRGTKATVLKDTLIQGKIYSKLKEGCFKTIDSGRVYYFAQNNHHLLFDFNASIGDTFLIDRHLYPDTIVSSLVSINNIYYTKDINGVSVKTFVVILSTDPFFGIYLAEIHEKILIDNNENGIYSEDLFNLLEGRFTRMCCYREPNGFNFFRVDSGECDYVNTEEIGDLQNQIALYPNPNQEKLFIQNDTRYAIDHLEFYDLSGKQILKLIPNNVNEVETTSFPGGNYWLIIEFTNHNRIIKQVSIASK